MKKIICSLLCCTSILTGCLNNDYLEKYPLDKQTEQTAFVTYENFKTYSWGLYEQLGEYTLDKLYGPEAESDNMFKGTKNAETEWAWQKVKVPASGGGWDYTYIRRVNLMLDNVEKSQLTEKEQEHWRGIGYFFRAFRYFELLSRFGDVVWVEHTLNNSSPELFSPRDSRDLIAQNMLDNLKYAEEHIKAEGDGANTITPDVVKALISRFCLFEGTWRKYHGLNDAETYLKECKRVSEELVNKYPKLHSNYDEVFNSQDLSGVDGILLFRQYEINLSAHSVSRLLMSSSSRYEMTKDAVDSYLCSDGRTIRDSKVFEGEKDPYMEFRKRDRRLLFTVCPPYKIGTPPEAFTPEWWYTDNTADAEYFDVMETISSEGYKTFPIRQNGGSVLKFCPHFTQHNGGFGFQVSEGGYWVYKHLNHHENYPVSANSSDAPLFRMGEIMLNYAEAMWELGEFNQNIADKTINKLRERADVAPMVLTDITASFDPNRDSSVHPVLWEIRRERRVEMMGDGFRFDDLRRWKKCEYLNKQKLGRWYSAKQLIDDGLIKNESQCKLKFKGGGKEGYIEFFGDPVKEGYGWKEHYYLYPLPLNDLALNPQLKQNPGWE
ncbi:MAG: RagB/SusD family nutrient uptake outer membrane protein [Parabacteroides gordonii]|uniref:RagB/SusD family nutrient uptake outer membrane protein n=1 Tax=Parabacteroides gordonii TaxID=574930 RepID=UPI003A858301